MINRRLTFLFIVSSCFVFCDEVSNQVAFALPSVAANVGKTAPDSYSSSTQTVAICLPQNEAKRFSFWGSFIYWQPIQSCMEVGMEASFAAVNNGPGNSHRGGKVIEMQADYAPGFKAGFACQFPKTNWSFFADFTYLTTENSLKRHKDEDGFLYSRWIQPDLLADNASTKLKAKWDLKADLLNVEVGRSFFAGSKLELIPQAGLGVAWFDQEYSGRYHLISPAILLKVRSEGTSWGIGPRLGIRANWHLLPYFSLIGEAASEILFTRYDLKVRQKAENDPLIFLSSSDHINAIRPEIEMYIGAAYKAYFGKTCRYFKLEAGYDFQIWWNQNMIRWYTDSTYVGIPEGNLAFQGLRVTAGFGF